jgi:hypothetical protein
MYPQPDKYRIRLYKKNQEVSYGQHYGAVLDFCAGPGLWATKGQLDALVQSLAWVDGARDEDTLKYRLSIHEWDTDRHFMDWAATSWHNPTPEGGHR